jgi:hypothetical protein
MTRLSADDYRDFRRLIRQEKRERIREFEDEIANDARMAPAKAAGPDVLRLIAQGDSWFDYLPGAHVDIVAHLRSLSPQTPKILNLAHYGESTEDMLGLEKLAELRDQLRNPRAGPFDAILFSGGGNDLAGNQFRLWLNDRAAAGGNPASGLNRARVGAILGVIKAGYEDLIATRNSFAKSAWIFTHGYDFAIPTGKGVCNVGPWLQPGLLDRGWADLGDGKQIVRDLLLEFDAMLAAFARTATNFVHVRTQGTLSDGDWDNELHPLPSGFSAITQAFVVELRKTVPGRI